LTLLIFSYIFPSAF